MLLQRVLTAICLLLVILAVIFLGDYRVWALFSTALAILGMIEYGKIVKLSNITQAIFLILSVFFMFGIYASDIIQVISQTKNLNIIIGVLLGVFWLIFIPIFLKQKGKINYPIQGMFFGWVLFIPFWLCLINLFPPYFDELSFIHYKASSLSYLVSSGFTLNHLFSKEFWLTGLINIDLLVLYLILLVWVADIGAYFVGKAFGRHKLAPTISPGKSIEGAIGAVVLVMLYSTLYYEFFVHYIFIQFNLAHLVILLLISIPLTCVSIIGDLLESWLKRTAGVKDSSQLLPGHGGFFDRIDSLIAVLSLYPLVYFCVLQLHIFPNFN